MTDNRLQLLFDLLEKHNVDAVAINPGPALTYLTGLHFHLMERPTILLVSKKGKIGLILPELEAGKIAESRIPLTPFTFGDNPGLWPNTINEAVKSLGLESGRIGVEPIRLRFLELNFLQQAAPQAKFVGAEALFSDLRLCKDESEIDLMLEAIRIAQEGLRATLSMIKVGVSEQEIASELVINMFRLGSEPELPFAPIVAGGPNSANPHATPTDRKIQNGDLLVIDWGATFAGYCSDLTRTFAIGKVDEELRTIFEAVKSANEAGRAAGAPGKVAGTVDQAARDVIEKVGYGKFFTHRTGHGLGMEAHEEPYMFGESQQVLKTGMVYTVEPGIYLPGHGGVRIEDNVVVTAEGARTLTTFPRDFTVLG